MAKAFTTHVIEIETGIGEPAFIPLTLGQELQPISVGKKGMWRIESARVLDVHAFVYFDGTALFLQSADEGTPASVDGYRVGKAWTELHPPCSIEIGAARVRYRSLTAEASPKRPPHARTPPPPIQHVQPIEDPPTFPKADQQRPFRPGELVNGPGDGSGSTRVASQKGGPSTPPMAAHGHAMGGRVQRMTGPPRPPETMPAAPMNPIQEGTLGITPVQTVLPVRGRDMPLTGPVHPGVISMHDMGVMGSGPHHPGGAHDTGPPPMGSAPPPPGTMQMYPPGSMPAQGSYAPPPHPSGGYGSMTGGGTAGQTGAPPPGLLARYGALSIPKRILIVLAPLCVAASAYLVHFDDVRPYDPQASLDAGADAGSAAPASSLQAMCPPGFVPYSVPVAGGAIPCVPAGTPMPPAPTTSTATPLSPTPPPPAPAPPNPVWAQPPLPVADAGAAPALTRTLERLAVDAVASNDHARAAAYYAQLQAQNPQNRVYAEAARILRAKADAGP